MILLVSSVLFLMLVTVRSECPGNFCSKSETCCPGESDGDYGCCLFPNAVCCPNKLHCCPAGTLCDDSTGSCRTQLGRLIHTSNEITDVPTNGSANAGDCMYCDKDNPCCPLVTGGSACCPFAHGTCCNHSIYCCPGKEKCDLSSGWCKV